MTAQQQLLQILQHKIQHDELVLPTLPDIALKVRQRSADPNVSLIEMADILYDFSCLVHLADSFLLVLHLYDLLRTFLVLSMLLHLIFG